MAAKVRTSPLRQVAPGLWEVVQMRQSGGVIQRFRMTVVKLAAGGLWLYSPVEIDDDVAGQLAAAGQVTDIVAPNRYHHLFAGGAKTRYPAATLWAVPGLPEKRRDLAFDRVLTADAPSGPWPGDLDALILTSVPRFNEAVFFHRGSGTLICADFFFNIHNEEGFATRLLYRALGVYGKPGQSWYFRKSIDRRAAPAQFKSILAWDPGRICMSHGDVLETDARAILAGVLGPL